MDDFDDIIILDEDDFDDDLRNARRGRSKGRRRRSTKGMLRRRPGEGVRPRDGSRSAGPVVRRDTGGLSTGILIEAGAQALAAIQPLPNPPLATGRVETDVGNMILYQQALAQHAKRDEQIRTIGSLASKLFA